MKFDIVQLLGALAVFIPAVLGAIKTYKNASDSDKRLLALEEWQKSQDMKLQAIKDDNARAFKDQGQSRTELKWLMREMRGQLGETKQQLAKVPTRTEFGYRREGTLEFTPLPVVAPKVDPITERHEVDPFPDVDPEFKPKKKR